MKNHTIKTHISTKDYLINKRIKHIVWHFEEHRRGRSYVTTNSIFILEDKRNRY